ncbi:MAG: 30S ribosomal protein S16 [Deltaproteobacteria bacterium]|nr:30S ribosomal protein S16 [Deltaproteobacteria bacterium]
MAVTIRLQRHGKHKRPFYRIVATDSPMRRDGRYLELVGTYDTFLNPPVINLKEDRVKYWLGVGATTSDTVANIIDKTVPGFLADIEKKRTDKIRSKRAARKARKAKLAA